MVRKVIRCAVRVCTCCGLSASVFAQEALNRREGKAGSRTV